ncbi:MAG: acyl-ACP--UDP-N-acetylglucosamine O-acyltransferase [Planctomycetota bacterium]|jgi:UDP-N-acetylglucosamine acyltransferase
MPTLISPLSQVHSSARIGNDVEIGPFCVVGPDVSIGDGTKLDSHVAVTGQVTIGERNRFWPNCVIGGEPQDVSFRTDADTGVDIGDDNMFREGVTVNRGAEKEDHWTRIGNGNMLMSNAHVAHNCRIYNNTFLVNGVLLGGHVHVQDRAIVSGNSVVHHFATIGTMAFVSGGCRCPQDVPPFMLACGSDNPEIRTINIVGMRRAGISEESIRLVKRAHRLIYREHKRLPEVKAAFEDQLGGEFPQELQALLTALENQAAGKQGRAREAFRDVKLKVARPDGVQQSKAA